MTALTRPPYTGFRQPVTSRSCTVQSVHPGNRGAVRDWTCLHSWIDAQPFFLGGSSLVQLALLCPQSCNSQHRELTAIYPMTLLDPPKKAIGLLHMPRIDTEAHSMAVTATSQTLAVQPEALLGTLVRGNATEACCPEFETNSRFASPAAHTS